jgi:hypothetical protein
VDGGPLLTVTMQLANRGRHVTTIRLGTFSLQTVGDCFVFVHTHESPSDAEWDQALELYRAAPRLDDVRSLTLSYGGAPSAKQRARLNALFGEHKPRMVMLTSSEEARAAGVAISWFNPRLKVFAIEELSRALEHLELPMIDRCPVVETLNELHAALLKDRRKSG